MQRKIGLDQYRSQHFGATLNPDSLAGLPIDGESNADLKDLRQRYKHKRLESKQQLVNHYRSLSLMQGDDPAKALKKSAVA